MVISLHSLGAVLVMILLLGVGLGSLARAQAESQTYYVDCESGSDANAGTSPEAAWQTLDQVNATTFNPGDTILFKRGTVCAGMLWPKGSGAEGAPVTVGAYGIGPLPVIDGGENEAALKLFNQEYWHVRELEITGGTKYGVLIGARADRRALRHYRLTNLVVHDVIGGPVQTKWSGLVVFAPEGDHPVFEDIVIDGVTAYNTNQWGGIVVNGGNWPVSMENPAFGAGVTVRNSTVYNVYGDGIVLWYVKDGLIEHSVAYDTGQQPAPQTIGTPGAIWTWACHDCTVQFNEAYRSASPDVDAGCFDVDWGTKNNVFQYNYGHDSDGYCLSVFGAEGFTTENAIVRYNVCQNNARRGDTALRQGDMFISTWNGGALDGVQIYNNTFFWNPAQNAPLLKNGATFRGDRPAFFKNNLIVSTSNLLVESNRSLDLDHNLYWVVAEQERDPFWSYGGTYRSFDAFQRGSRQEANGLYADPTLGGGDVTQVFLLPDGSPAIGAGGEIADRGAFDAFQNPIPAEGPVTIGAFEGFWEPLTPGVSAPLDLLGDDLEGQIVLVGFVNAAADGSARDLSRSQIVFLRSMAQQYGDPGVRVILVDTSGADAQTLTHAAYNWQLGAIPLLPDDQGALAAGFGVTQPPTTILIGADGRVLRRWDRFAAAQDLAFVLQALVGPPVFE